MTTTVGLISKHGVVLASDSRATMGSYIASIDAEKIHKINENMAITTAGGVGDAQVLARIAAAESENWKITRGKFMTVKAVATFLSDLLNRRKFYPYEVQLLMGGMDEDGTSHIFSIDAHGGRIEEKVTATGSGSPVASGALEVLLEGKYSEDMSIEVGKKFAVRAIEAAKKKDSATGNTIEVVTITKEKGYETEKIKDGEVKQFMEGL